MKCNKCGYDDNGSGDSAHVCGPVNFPSVKAAKEEVKQHIKFFNEMMGKEPKEPEQEPDAIITVAKNSKMTFCAVDYCRLGSGEHKLYITPPQRKPLTDEEQDECVDIADEAHINRPIIFWSEHHYKAIESKLKEKNGV